MKFTDGLFLRSAREVAKELPRHRVRGPDRRQHVHAARAEARAVRRARAAEPLRRHPLRPVRRPGRRAGRRAGRQHRRPNGAVFEATHGSRPQVQGAEQGQPDRADPLGHADARAPRREGRGRAAREGAVGRDRRRQGRDLRHEGRPRRPDRPSAPAKWPTRSSPACERARTTTTSRGSSHGEGDGRRVGIRRHDDGSARGRGRPRGRLPDRRDRGQAAGQVRSTCAVGTGARLSARIVGTNDSQGDRRLRPGDHHRGRAAQARHVPRRPARDQRQDHERGRRATCATARRTRSSSWSPTRSTRWCTTMLARLGLPAAARDRHGRRARLRALQYFIAMELGVCVEDVHGHGARRPRRHDGAGAEPHLGRRRIRSTELLPTGQASTRSSSARATAAARS